MLADSSPSGGFFSSPSSEGTWVFNAVNTYSTKSTLGCDSAGSAVYTIGTGSVVGGVSSAFGTGTITFGGTTAPGPTLRGQGASAITLNNAFSFTTANRGKIAGSTPLTFAGSLAFGAAGGFYLTVANSADTIFSGTVSDSAGGFQMTSGSTGRLVILNGNNTYTGWTDMAGGKLAIGGSPNALGATGNNRATLAMHTSSATGCYVGTYGGPQTVSSGQPSIYMDANGSFNNTDTLTFNAPYALDCGNGPSSTLGLYNTADVIISGLVISAGGMGGTTSSGAGPAADSFWWARAGSFSAGKTAVVIRGIPSSTPHLRR